jgi:GNAT superfamily N-acetyltransferase
MTILQTKSLNQIQKEAIFKIWNSEYPEKLNYETITQLDDYLELLLDQNHYLLQDENEAIKGWCFTFLRNSERWFAIIIASQFQGKGFGKLLLNTIKKDEKSLNAWVMDHNNDFKNNGEIYKSPLAFYLKNGFQIIENEFIRNEKISAIKIFWKE